MRGREVERRRQTDRQTDKERQSERGGKIIFDNGEYIIFEA